MTIRRPIDRSRPSGCGMSRSLLHLHTLRSGVDAGRTVTLSPRVEPKYLYGRTRAEVADKLAKAHSDHQAGQLIADERVTVQQFLDTWLETVRPSVVPSTWTRYETLLRLHAVPSFGKLRLTRLGPVHLEQLYVERPGRRPRRSCSSTESCTMRSATRCDGTSSPQRLRAGHAAAEGALRLPGPVSRPGPRLPPGRQGRPARSALRPGDRHRDARGRAVRAALGRRQPSQRLPPPGQAAQGRVLPPPGAPPAHRGRGPRPPPRPAGGGAPVGRLGVGGQRTGVPQRRGQAAAPVELPVARLLPAAGAGEAATRA